MIRAAADDLERTAERFGDYIKLERACSENTRRAYLSDLSIWTAWCRRNSRDPLDVQADAVSRFLLEAQIEEMAKNRRTQRAKRDKSGLKRITIAGYTNAGKSTLMNYLTGAGILAEDKLFATLDPTTRRLRLPSGKTALLTDTVGFIRNLPHHLIKAFASTLDEVRYADIILMLTDASDSECLSHAEVTRELLSQLGADGKKVLYVFNKCDLVREGDLSRWCASFDEQGKTYVKAVGTSGDCSAIVEGLKRVASDKLARFGERGAKVSVRAMVVGVPNSGKSTLINAMCKRAGAVTGDRPGVTRGKQWMSVGGVDLLDTPGTLWGKFTDESVAKHLGYIGSIRDEVLDVEELAYAFLEEVREEYSAELKNRYALSSVSENTLTLFEDIAAARGFKVRGGEPDLARTARCILDDFRKGRIGRIMLEKPKTQGLVLKKKG